MFVDPGAPVTLQLLLAGGPLVLAFGVEGARRPGWRMAALFALVMSGLVSVYPIFAARALAALVAEVAPALLVRIFAEIVRRGALYATATLSLGLETIARP